MRGNFFLKNPTFYPLSVILAFTFFTGGCHTGNEFVPTEPAAVKKAEAEPQLITKQKHKGSQKKIPGTLAKSNASGILLSEPEKDPKEGMSQNVSAEPGEKEAETSVATLRDPFSIPEELKNKSGAGEHPESIQAQYIPAPPSSSVLQNGRQENKKLDGNPRSISPAPYPQNTAAAYASRPFYQATGPVLSGIFDNGKEKYILLHWNQIQGVFQNGETLPNGYRVEEITASAVTLRPTQSVGTGEKIVLTLQQP